MNIFEEVKQIHLIGIGGIGLSALARFFLNQGKKVTGSDSENSDLIQDLIKEGAKINLGHGILPEGTEMIVYSEAIPDSNPERIAGKNLPSFNYFDALAEISKDYKLLAIAGTHGKTSTSAMLGFLLAENGYDPSVLVGSKVPQFGNSNFRAGKSEWMVVEACEYRRNFAKLKPYILGITNMELDHTDYFKDEEDYKKAFADLSARSKKVIKNAPLYDGNLLLPGEHNKANAGLALAIAKEIRIRDFSALERFTGTWRRFEDRGFWNSAPVIDDYAHHPTEIRATLKAVKEKYPNRRIFAVFQPHQHSRTLSFAEDFADSLKGADFVLLPNIYATRDSDEHKESMGAEDFFKILLASGLNAHFSGSLESAKIFIDENLKETDVLLIMGAGDVFKILDRA